MSLLVKHNWSDTSVSWLETNHIQVAICNTLRKHPEYQSSFDFAARFNEGKKSKMMGMMLKLAGLVPGECDLQIYLSQSRVVHVELKGPDTPTKKTQLDRHKQLRNIGHHVYLVRADCPQSGVDQVMHILNKHLQ